MTPAALVLPVPGPPVPPAGRESARRAGRWPSGHRTWPSPWRPCSAWPSGPARSRASALLDPALARQLAAAAAASPRTQLCLTVTSPEGYAAGHGCARPEPAPRRATQPGPAPPAGTLAGLPARLNLTIPAATLHRLTGLTQAGSAWGLTPRGSPGPPRTRRLRHLDTHRPRRPQVHRAPRPRAPSWTATTATRPAPTSQATSSATSSRSATAPAPSRPATATPAPATSSTPPPTTRAAAPARATPAHAPAPATRSSSPPAGHSPSPDPGGTSGPPPPAGSTSKNPGDTQPDQPQASHHLQLSQRESSEQTIPSKASRPRLGRHGRSDRAGGSSAAQGGDVAHRD